jgi:hypothetical protein
MFVRDLIVALFVVTVLGLQTMRNAKADMLVLESNVPEFPIGARLPDQPGLKLPPGGRVKVLLITSGESKVFEQSRETSSRSTQQPYGGTRKLRTPEKE